MFRGGGLVLDGFFFFDEDIVVVEDINLIVFGFGFERVVGNLILCVFEVGVIIGWDVEYYERIKVLFGNGVGDVGVFCILF